MNEVAVEFIKKPKESKYEISVMLLLSIYSFFGYLLSKNVPYYILVVSAVAIIFSLMIKKNIVISYQQLILAFLIMLFVLTQLLLARYSLFPSNSMKTAINRSAILVIGVFIYFQGNWYKNGIKFLFAFSCIHALFTIVSYLLPTAFYNIVLPVFPSEISSEISRFMSSGVYPGITDQIGRNAFYISVGISILYGYLVTYNRKSVRLAYIVLAFLLLTLLLTGKRGHLVANLIAMLFVSSIYGKIEGKGFLKRFFKIALFLSQVLLLLIYLFPEAAAPFVRFIERQGGDQTSGRIFLYINAIELFKQKPIWGWGCGVFSNLYGTGTHNIYLQLLAENGLIGFLLFFSILVFNFANTLKAIKKSMLNNENQYGIYLIFSLYIQMFYLIYGFTGNPLNDGFILIIYLIASSIPYTLKVKRYGSNAKFSNKQRKFER